MMLALQLSVSFILLLLAELLYFRIANKYNIIDKPNQRSSHTRITIRGGGIIYPVALVIFAVMTGFRYPWLFAGALIIGIISFMDDVITLSSRYRLPFQFLGIILMLTEAGLSRYQVHVYALGLILAVGTINAYNFMDGINGISSGYAFSILIPCLFVNESVEFVEPLLIYILLIANLIFAFFNYRKRARCFAGDVGSVSLAFILVYLIIKLLLKTSDPIFIFFFLIYGVDSVLTIIHRLFKKENIFEAHRSHLYQYLANEMGYSHLTVATAYSILQLLISSAIIRISLVADASTQLWIMFALGLFFAMIYILSKRSILKKISNPLSQ